MSQKPLVKSKLGTKSMYFNSVLYVRNFQNKISLTCFQCGNSSQVLHMPGSLPKPWLLIWKILYFILFF